MPLTFSFDASTLTSAGYLDRADLTTGSYPGLDYPTYFSGVAPSQSIATSGGVDVFAMTLVAGGTYKFDIDSGVIDLELDIIDQTGLRVGGSDNYGTSIDPFLSLTASRTGTYFVAVHHAANDYVDGSFRFEGTPGPTGAYSFAVSTPTLPTYNYTLTNLSDSKSYSDNSQTVRALGGNDSVWLNGGNDIGLGGDGADTVYGGIGSDELSGAAGQDRLDGDAGDDVLRGGADSDRLDGGSDRDSLQGGSGNDVLSGGSGNDILWGESGGDTLYGGDGNDVLRGGDGLDVMYGGAGVDTFHFLPGEAPANDYATEDRIEDFQIGDVIDLSDLAWGVLSWRGTLGFTAANQVRIVELSSGYTDVRVNLDADSTAELEVLVKPVGGFHLIQDDFIL
ncbi:RTX toxin [Rubellimicrobium mesophilum DSM 19309]|uniref:RTX toxin n=1 Tax=Rubellimicrobium mesophilum DSM 19309 TaxID=442562 RepID=A0A017HLX1_9RHOB|nr:pre-peptidase C-terminal domain-containing protein [Rubellimicrobium mesophilum]EYD75482.1 RTX toxin [Rubellimicrobium mesophilum DSM 19309]